MLIKTYILPHPPIVLPEIGQGEEKKIQATFDSFEKIAEEIALLKPETIIVTSPHAPAYRDGFYMGKGDKAVGSLAQFGRHDLKLSLDYDRKLANEIFKTDKLPMAYGLASENLIDHGTFVPLYFINNKYKDFKLVMIGISGLNAEAHFKLGNAIKKAVDKLDRRAIFIASGDLSHVLKEDGPYGFKQEGVDFDKKLVDILKRGDFKELKHFPEKMIEDAAQCGIRSFQIMAGALDGLGVRPEFLSYENTFGVGYAALSYDLEDPYVKLAQATIEKYIREGEIIEPSNLPREMLSSKAATFVSLHKDGSLRGCIGTLEPVRANIAEEIISNAISASTRDSRFLPVTVDELKDLEISVDVLENAEDIDSIEELDPKIYGVIVSKDFRKGVLLPNIEGVDDASYQVEIALRKAGIHPAEDFKMQRFKVIRHG